MEGGTDDIIVKDIVLVGGGHAHVFVMKNFGMKPLPNVRVTLITKSVLTPYSGMLPAHVAGHYTRDECHVDLGKLARFGKCRLVLGTVVGIDRRSKMLQLEGDRPDIPYDLLSLDIGSSPGMLPLSPDRDWSVTAVKPIDGFSTRWDHFLQKLAVDSSHTAAKPFHVAVVGGGPGGVELALSMQHRLSSMNLSVPCKFVLLSAGESVLPAHNARVQDKFKRILAERGFEVVFNARIVGVQESTSGSGSLQDENGRTFVYDECFWCTTASAQPWLKETGLACDEDGFIKVNEFLESENSPGVFAAGDVACMVANPRPKAGVYAVRHGPALAVNLRAAAVGEAMTIHIPQTNNLAIIGTGDRYAVLSRGVFAMEGAYLWKIKDWIDKTWMSKYSDLPEMPVKAPRFSAAALAGGDEVCSILAAKAMRCGGCGSKVGSTVLSRAMARVDAPTRDEVVIGLDAPDDGAVVRLSAADGDLSVQTIDFFRSFVDDPYVFGQIAAVHALSDCHAMGAEPISAMAIAQLPHGLEDKMENDLVQMMAGACKALKDSDCALVGGHTAEADQLGLGFAVVGRAAPDNILTKGGMAPGDVLIVSKPIGTGALFAADMRCKANGAWVAVALEQMTTSNRGAAGILQEVGATACTDVTGFGLLGHLVEMLKASGSGGVGAVVDLDALPVLPGALEVIAEGIFSSLQPSNLRLRRALTNQEDAAGHPVFPLIFDPQTAGGLLASVPQDRADECLERLRADGLAAAIIGRIVEGSGDPPPVTLKFDRAKLCAVVPTRAERKATVPILALIREFLKAIIWPERSSPFLPVLHIILGAIIAIVILKLL